MRPEVRTRDLINSIKNACSRTNPPVRPGDASGQHGVEYWACFVYNVGDLLCRIGV